jgi:5-methyltetrahydrofolate--homocysteine methyltransferase
MESIAALRDAVIEGRIMETGDLTEKALASGTSPKDILDQALIAGMDKVGDLFKCNEIYVPEVLLAAKSMQQAMQILKPHLVKQGVEPRGKVVVGTVRGDLHDIGKNLVAMMLEGAGFEIVDLGNDVTAERFVEAAIEHEAGVIGMSALLTTTMHVMKDTIEILRTRDPARKIRTMIGGAPVTQNYATEIGADGYGDDAATAVDLAKSFMGG